MGTSPAIGKPQLGDRLVQCDLLVSLTGRLAGVFRDAFPDIRHRSGERFTQLLRVSCALRFTEICNVDKQLVQQMRDAKIFRVPGSQGRDLPTYLDKIERFVFRRPLQNETRAWPANEADASSMMARGLRLGGSGRGNVRCANLTVQYAAAIKASN